MAIIIASDPARAGSESGTSAMSFSRRLTGGLAWAGLLLVIAVPSADAITAVFIPENQGEAEITLASKPVIIAPTPATRKFTAPVVEQAAAPAVIDPVETASTADAVDAFLDQGNAMPAYISGEDRGPVETATLAPDAVASSLVTPANGEAATLDPEVAAVETTPASAASGLATDPGIDPIEVASITPDVAFEATPEVTFEAPVPMPALMRPKGTQSPGYRVGDERPGDEVVLPGDVVLPNDVVLSDDVADRDFASNDRIVTADELEDWEYGPLSDYLERQQRGDSEVVIRNRSSDFDDDGFFLDEGPNHRRPQRELIGPVEDDDFFFPFLN